VGSVCALAYVHRSVTVPGDVSLRRSGEGGTDALTASVRTLPFL
jgi:hypothetical protein